MKNAAERSAGHRRPVIESLKKRELTRPRNSRIFALFSRHWWFARSGKTPPLSKLGWRVLIVTKQSHPMAGHNKWSKVKRLKGALDQKRGKLFSKLAKEITVAAKMGGGDPAGNPRLRAAVLAARAQSVPNDNIARAIERGTGEGTEAAAYEELIYEGYAPGGVALLIEAATDNKNRTAADLRLIFSKNQGHLGSSGSVAYLFKRKGQIFVPRNAADEDTLLGLALDAGAEDMYSDDGHHVILTAHDQLYAVAERLRSAGVIAESLKLTYNPESTIQVADEQIAAQVLRLCEALEDNDDVQDVHANFELAEKVLEKVPG